MRRFVVCVAGLWRLVIGMVILVAAAGSRSSWLWWGMMGLFLSTTSYKHISVELSVIAKKTSRSKFKARKEATHKTRVGLCAS